MSMSSDRWRNTVIKWLDRLVPIVFIVCDRGDRYLSTGVFPV